MTCRGRSPSGGTTPDIPTAVREAVYLREQGRCLRCGAPATAEFAHRRTRAVLGPHRHCPCNGAHLCRRCHQWCHDHPGLAMTEGFMVSRHQAEPGRVPVNTWYGRFYLLCDGDLDPKIREE